MSVRTVFDTILDGTGAPITLAPVTLYRRAGSFSPAASLPPSTVEVITNEAGYWAADLTPNTEAVVPNTWLAVYPNGDGFEFVLFPGAPISVPELRIAGMVMTWSPADLSVAMEAYRASWDLALDLHAGTLATATEPAHVSLDMVVDTASVVVAQHAAILSDADTAAHVDLTTIQDMIDVTAAAISSSSTWLWKAAAQSGDPGTNSAGMNDNDAASATIFYINRLGAGGTDYAGMIASLRSGDAIYIQQVSDATRWQRLQVTAAPSVTGNAFAVPITHLGVGSGGEPVDSAPLFVNFSPSVSGSGIPPVGGEVPDNSVSSIKIVDLSIVAGDLASNSVTEPKIAVDAVTTTKIANSAVTGAKVVDRTLSFAKLELDAQLVQWTEGEAFQIAPAPATVTYDPVYPSVVLAAPIVWPDGSAGTFTTDLVNASHMIDAYHITHVSGSRVVTQTAVTRDANGMVLSQPALVVGAL